MGDENCVVCKALAAEVERSLKQLADYVEEGVPYDDLAHPGDHPRLRVEMRQRVYGEHLLDAHGIPKGLQ